MAGSGFGNIFRITTWGESHGKALGVVIDGCPSGLIMNEEIIQKDLDRRKPGASKFGTKRQEGDKVEILSGVFEGKTTGTPISLAVFNQDQRSRDYGNIMNVYRPGHADFCFDSKYGFRDYRGGGRSSGRETLSRVAAGAVARAALKELGVEIFAFTKSVGSIEGKTVDKDEVFNNPLCMADKEAAVKASELMEKAMSDLDSVGGVVECRISGMPVGIGEPVFDKLDAALSKAVMSIGAVKGVELGEGFGASLKKGSENNDPFFIKDGKTAKAKNSSGGVLGGMSDGDEIILRAAFKPTPSISQPQMTVNRNGKEEEIVIKGRHDPIIVPRAVVVVEAMAAVTVLDLMLVNMASKMENVKKIYGVKI
ncbi:MAG: chorismate synthase [Eubacterium sp.]|nr:chorismate synthase [Eubacterium sp.]